MPYVKEVKRFNINKEHIKSDYYLAEQIMKGDQRTENIIRTLTPQEAKLYSKNTERNQDKFHEVTEHTEQYTDLVTNARILFALFQELSNNQKVMPEIIKWGKAHPDKVEAIKQLEEMIA